MEDCMKRENAKGSCLCGGVTLHVPVLEGDVGVCHCSMCRKWAGGPFFALECSEDITIEGEEFVGVYASSEWAERAFCKRCGSNLFYRLKEGGFKALSAGLFAQSDLHMAQQIFIDEKPAYYDFANDTPKLTGEEVFAAFAPKEG
jgi:hypothetical protein